MSASDVSDLPTAHAATPMKLSSDEHPCTSQQRPLPTRTSNIAGSGAAGTTPGSVITPQKKSCVANTLDITSPPPRPPKRSESSDRVRDKDGASNHFHKLLQDLEPPVNGSGLRNAAFDGTDATPPQREMCATRGPFSSLETSDSGSRMLFSTTQLLNATTMPLPPLEGSRGGSDSVLSPSVHQPSAAVYGRGNNQHHAAPAADALAAAAAAHNTTREAHGRYEPEGVWALGPRSGSLLSDGPASLAAARQTMPGSCSVLTKGPGENTADGNGNDTTSNHESECVESDDEDEDGLFQETVLFMNNTLHSLGSTRSTLNKLTPQQTSLLRGSPPSPVPSMPDSQDVTPIKPARQAIDRGHHGDEDLGECRADRGYAGSNSGNGGAAFGIRGYGASPPGMNASATTTSTQIYGAGLASPATTYGLRTPAPSVSPFLVPPPPLPPRADPPTPTTATAHRNNSPNTADCHNSEYLFIDNNDGTAYLADASLQLDGSYALGQTILLARSIAASPNSTSVRRGNGADGYSSCGAVSPVAVPQTADRLPQQREQYAHRPLRGTTLPEVATSMSVTQSSPGSPIPTGFDDSFASPVAPSVSRVLVRRSPAPGRDISVDGDGANRPSSGACVLPPAFSHSFCFDQTLLVPLDDTLKSSFASPVSPSVAEADLRGEQASAMRMQSVTNTAASSYRSTAPARWESATSLATSFFICQSSRSHEPSTPNSVSRLSPIPHAPSAAQHIASQQARATRDTRPSRAEQDIIYLVPPGVATATITPKDITQQGWIPVQVVEVLPVSSGSPAINSGGGRARNGGGNLQGMAGGRTVSPLPKDPGAPTYPSDEMNRNNGEDEVGKDVVREQSLSRRSHGRADEQPTSGAVHSSSFSLASTLSASTLDRINRRLSYSLSGWASARQRFGHSMSAGDSCSASGMVMPPATPLAFFMGDGDHRDSGEGSRHSCAGVHHQRQAMPVSTSVSCHCNLSIQLSGGEGRDSVEGAHLDYHNDGSPVPLPPGTPEKPQREQSPSRCTAVATPDKAQDTAEPPQTTTATSAAEEDAESYIANSLLTSMSYRRPSTMTASDEYPGDYSMSLPLTSSASQSIGLNGGHARNSYTDSLNARHHLSRHQALRAPHPRRVSDTTALSQAASSFSFQIIGEQSDHHAPRLSSNLTTPVSAAAATSFRTTYCNNRTSPGSVTATSLNPSVGGAGLPLSRGTLGASAGARNAGGAGPASHFPPQKLKYPQQYAAAAERRRAGLARPNAHVNASSLNVDSFAARSGAVSRNLPQHHPYLSAQQQRARRAETTRRATGGGGGGGGGGSRRQAGARLVPDTSVFLPWAPLTITPDGSLNLGRFDKDGVMAMEAAGRPHMNLMPYTSSAETSTRTTATFGMEGIGVQEMTQQWADSETTEISLEALHTLNATVAAVPWAADVGGSEGFWQRDGAVNKEAFVASFLQHVASQADVSGGDRSLNTASMRACEVHLQDLSQRCDLHSLMTMEAPLSQLQEPPSAVSAQEPEPRVPAAAEGLSSHAAVAVDRENQSAVRASAARSSGSMGVARPAGLREGSLANMVHHSGKARSPSHGATAVDTTATARSPA
ncbi:hypothetical protein ABL78_4535 [Leptomonas seymouri]|uniref:Uncharacterized protein n=1 Tax=Leptomonas seymouri TaxID=5684 RepID=A0A0N0P5G0_LEPSE|nr:hypothetical protein ABL78_4535 [Leptomonas seymouri]|eukprot:KPI86419.1 hypothetical protein ABL78_4535 [Leptomonas seymouri]